ncbi:hypothetical protein [Undibacterium crateris]|uniref:hypothetical protein n=1 Tax=Undibacterium crateris TaxID=2528175 RepID=UPI00138A4471|nr:hypothetical protein [Undibacterium crateris]NDI85358.1 hypothetical protein [Undibacterium crateris]
MKTKDNNYWFPAKTCGWSWGIPNSWHGWVVLAVYLLAILLMTGLVQPVYGNQVSLIGICAASLVLIAVCWLKGEPPRWRWGR